MSEIKPALTAEEWQEALRDRASYAAAFQRAWNDPAESAESEHPLAAFALYGQPFGFTWQDVRALREEEGINECLHDIERLNSIADRIAALLPPEPK